MANLLPLLCTGEHCIISQNRPPCMPGISALSCTLEMKSQEFGGLKALWSFSMSFWCLEIREEPWGALKSLDSSKAEDTHPAMKWRALQRTVKLEIWSFTWPLIAQNCLWSWTDLQGSSRLFHNPCGALMNPEDQSKMLMDYMIVDWSLVLHEAPPNSLSLKEPWQALRSIGKPLVSHDEPRWDFMSPEDCSKELYMTIDRPELLLWNPSGALMINPSNPEQSKGM